MELKDRMRDLRTQKKMTQEELGERVGLQKAAINKYESGIVVNPKRSLIEKLARALDTTPCHLMGWDDYTDTKESHNDATLQEILGIYNTLNKDGHEDMLKHARYINSLGEYKKSDTFEKSSTVS
jgi:transcriptional regulator with XRE-family HTH domain